MTLPPDVRELLERLAAGSVSVDDAAAELARVPSGELGFACIDHDRKRRQGFPEVIYCPGKTPEQVRDIVGSIRESGHSVLATRAAPEVYEAVRAAHPDAFYHADARCITVQVGDVPERTGRIAVVSAGTSDIPVAEEAALTAEWGGAAVERIYDVGVAGLHRLLRHLPALRSARAVVVVAGMEGALPSVVGGLIDRPIIAVPTSVGYGMHFGGLAPLLAMLNSCAPGITVVNVDNGFGAGLAAASINRVAELASAR